LDVNDANYGHWRCFFDEVLGKFGLTRHVRSPPPLDERDAEWRMVDHYIVSWIYATVSKSVFDIVHKLKRSAFSLWGDVEGLFRDNELQRVVYLEAEFRSLKQGDMSITQYCAKLKHLADQLRDVGHAVSEPSQVLNLLRGLNPRFRHVKPVIKAKFPPHTFMSARSFMILEELGEEHDAKADAEQALAAGHTSNAPSTGSTEASSSSGGSRGGPKNKKRGRGSGGSNNTNNSGGGGAPRPPSQPWAAGYNPWTGLVQAWPMPFRAPGAGVLGPRPPFQPQQAMTAAQLPPHLRTAPRCSPPASPPLPLALSGISTPAPPLICHLHLVCSWHLASSPTPRQSWLAMAPCCPFTTMPPPSCPPPLLLYN
jgi:hypothetical protein